jgi:hypothetical protein
MCFFLYCLDFRFDALPVVWTVSSDLYRILSTVVFIFYPYISRGSLEATTLADCYWSYPLR